MSDVPPAIRQACLERAGWACEHCGFTRPGGLYHLHHRKLRKQGGEHTMENLMVVTPSHHNVAAGSIHQEVDRSRRLGHLLRADQDPSLVPVQLAVPKALDRHELHLIVPESDWPF